MSNRLIQLIVGAFVLLICASLAFGAAADKDKAQGVAKTTTNDDYRAFTINNIFNYYSNNGDGSYNKYNSSGAFEFPKGTGRTCIFEDGVVWVVSTRDVQIPRLAARSIVMAFRRARSCSSERQPPTRSRPILWIRSTTCFAFAPMSDRRLFLPMLRRA